MTYARGLWERGPGPGIIRAMDDHETRCDKTFAARDAAWEAYGTTDPYFLSPMINPSFAGGPTWPNLRQAYRIIRGPLGTILASDGLSDPFDDSWADPPPQNGFALEVYTVAERDPASEILPAWMLPVVAGFAKIVAEHGAIHKLLDELGTLSTELYDVPIPEPLQARFVNEAGRVAVLVGLTTPEFPARFAGPVSPIRLVNLKLLTVDELGLIAANADAGRAELVRRFLAGPHPLVSSLTR